jgi:hypothetical protein
VFLNLAEVQLFGSAGAAIPTSSLNISASSEFDVEKIRHPIKLSFDGNKNTFGSTMDAGVPERSGSSHAMHTPSIPSHPRPDDGGPPLAVYGADLEPTLRVGYPCPNGSTSLSRVLVTNRLDSCCRSRWVVRAAALVLRPSG